MDKKEEGWIFPLSAPWVSPPPYHMTPESRDIYVFFDADIDALRYEVPRPLELAPKEAGPLAWVTICDAKQPPHTYTFYHEGLVKVRVKYKDTIGWYTPYIWTHTDEAMIAGHVLGIPKQICDNDPLEYVGNQVNAVLKRRGQTIFRIVFIFTSPPPAKRTEPVENKLAKYMCPQFYLKKVPSPEKGGKVLRQLVRVDLGDFKVAEIYEGNASLEFVPNGGYPNIHKLQPTKIYSAFHLHPDFYLPYGKIVWEEYK